MRVTIFNSFPSIIIRKYEVHVWDHALNIARIRNMDIGDLRVFDNEDGSYLLFDLSKQDDELIWKAYAGKFSYRNIISNSLLDHFNNVLIPDKSPFSDDDEFMSPPGKNN